MKKVQIGKDNKTCENRNIFLLSLIGRGGTYNCASIIASELSEKTSVSMLIPTYSKTELLDKKILLYKTYAPISLIKTVITTFNIFQHIKNIKIINNSLPEMVLFTDIHPWYIIYWPFVTARKKISLVHDVELHTGEGSTIISTILRFITSFLIKNSYKIIVLSKGQEKVLQKVVPKEKIILSRHGSFEFYETNATKKFIRKKPVKHQTTFTHSEKNTFLFFGRIKEYKGLRYLLEAAESLKRKGVLFKLIIAGEGDITPYEKLLDELKDNLELHIGYVPDKDVAEYFQRCSFVIMPYTDATQTGVVQVAYSFKKPVIATNVGSLPEVVIDGKTGVLIEPKNTREIEKAILRMLSNPDDVKKKGVAGYKFMKKELDWKNIVEKMWEDINKKY